MAFFNPSSVLLSPLFTGCTSALLLVGGLLIAFAGFWALRKEFIISKHGLVVPGTVIAIDARRKKAWRPHATRGYTTVYEAVVRFQPIESADPVTFTVTTGSFQVYQVNQPVRVIYVPTDQNCARIDGRMRWVAPCLGLCFGLGVATLTVILSLSLITIHW